jgi:hypothetical protein
MWVLHVASAILVLVIGGGIWAVWPGLKAPSDQAARAAWKIRIWLSFAGVLMLFGVVLTLWYMTQALANWQDFGKALP